jgi:hypothetical protein
VDGRLVVGAVKDDLRGWNVEDVPARHPVELHAVATVVLALVAVMLPTWAWAVTATFGWGGWWPWLLAAQAAVFVALAIGVVWGARRDVVIRPPVCVEEPAR